jgi:hypothetical protein
MASQMRWRYGDTNPVVLAVAPDTVIEIGDLVYLSTDKGLPASAQTDQGTAAANQQLFHSKFVGVAMQQSRAGDTQPVRIATTGVFEFDCASSTFEVGALLGVAQTLSAPVSLLNQTVVGVTAVNEAVGRCASRVNPAGKSVLVDIVSTVLYGGPQAAA